MGALDNSELVTVHTPRVSVNKRIGVFYLHGGGLLYGERDDLPSPYPRMFNDAGYTLICADYPLAPEADISEIMASAEKSFRSTVAKAVSEGELDGYFLFGRSSGAYLSFLLARAIAQDPALPQPLGILDFYGYYDLSDKAFSEPAKAYATLPEVSRAQVDRIAPAGTPAPTSGPKPLRYSLYVYARQHEGAWLRMCGIDGSSPDHSAEAWSLSASDIAALPPLFIAASSGDEDVPFRISKTLWRAAPNAKMKTVYYLPHDFDRDISNPAGKEAYTEAISWMNALVQ